VTPFSAGAVLRRSLAIWARNLAPFLLLTLIVMLPGQALHYLVESHRFSFDDEILDAAMPGLVDTVLVTIVSGAICWGAFQELRGKPLSYLDCILVGLRRLPSVLLIGLVEGLIVGIGLQLLIVPGLFLACVLYVVVPVTVIEKAGVSTALTRSAILTRGKRLQLFAIGVVNFGVSFGIGVLAVEAFDKNASALWTARVALVVASASFGAVTNTVAYHGLRAALDGHAPDDVADVFE
jgi:hypothetical protein